MSERLLQAMEAGVIQQRYEPLPNLCRACGDRPASWCEVLCSDCASLTDTERAAYERTGVHPRWPGRTA